MSALHIRWCASRNRDYAYMSTSDGTPLGMIHVFIYEDCRIQVDDVEETSISHSIVRRGSTRYVDDLCAKR